MLLGLGPLGPLGLRLGLLRPLGLRLGLLGPPCLRLLCRLGLAPGLQSLARLDLRLLALSVLGLWLLSAARGLRYRSRARRALELPGWLLGLLALANLHRWLFD